MYNKDIYGYIYKIKNTIDDKIYIGQAINGFNNRYNRKGNGIERVFLKLKSEKKHKRNYNVYLFYDILKYGFDNWNITECLDVAFSKEELDIKEQSWICIYKSNNPKYGYNNTYGGQYINKKINKSSIEKMKKTISKKNSIVALNGSKNGKEIIYNDINKINENIIYVKKCCKNKIKSYGINKYTNKRIVWRYKSDYDIMSPYDVYKCIIDGQNEEFILIFTDKGNRYIINKLLLDLDYENIYCDYNINIIKKEFNIKKEKIIKILIVKDTFKGDIISIYSNGKISRVKLDSFMSCNKKLSNCYNGEYKLIDIDYIDNDLDILLVTDKGNGIIINTKKINTKVLRSNSGICGIKLNKNENVIGCIINVNINDKFFVIDKYDKEYSYFLNDAYEDNLNSILYNKLKTKSIGVYGKSIDNKLKVSLTKLCILV